MKKQLLCAAVAFVLQTIAYSQISSLPPSYTVESTASLTPIFRAERERLHNLVHTKLDLKFDYQKQYVLGEAWLTLKPHFYASSSLELDAKYMDIHEVILISDSNQKKLSFSYDKLKLQIDLGQIFSKEEQFTIYIKYTAKPNEVEQEGSAAIHDAKGLYFINPLGDEVGTPTQIWTQGETESSSCWFPTIDSTNQKTSQEIYLTYPKKYVSLSNGSLISTKENSDDTKTDYWKFDDKHAPYLFFVGIGDYAVIEDSWKGIEVSYYVEPEFKEYARDIFGNTPEMMQFFSDLLDYPYPWEKYSQMTAREYVSGAMENTTASLFNDGVQQKPGQLIDENSAETVIAHELFHHWFGDLVTAENWTNLALNEAFANYSEYLWVEYKYGKEQADEYLNTQLNSYFMGDNVDKTLIRMHYKSREDMFDAVTYNKGGAILHMLRAYLGDEAFFKGLNKYLVTNKYGKAEVSQLRIALEEVSGRDLNWFFNQWFMGSGHPKLTFHSQYDAEQKKLSVEVIQTGELLFEFPYTIDIVTKKGVARKQFWVSKQKHNSVSFDVATPPEVVIANADQILISELEDLKNSTVFAKQYKYGKENFNARKDALEALAKVQTTESEALKVILEALQDPYEGIRIEAINLLDLNTIEVVDQAKPILKKLALDDSKTKVQAQAIQALTYANVVDKKILDQAFESVSFRVKAAAIDGLLTLDDQFVNQIPGDLDKEVVKLSSKLIAVSMPKWIAENQLDKADLIAEQVAMYIFIKFQDQDLGNAMEEGFKWIMANNTSKATEVIAQIHEGYFEYFKKMNPDAGQGIRIMAREALRIKQNAWEKNPTNALKKQVERLEQVVKAIEQ